MGKLIAGAVKKTVAKYIIPSEPKYSERNWNTLSMEGKINTMNEHMNEVADMLGIEDTPEMVLFYQEGNESGVVRGGYMHETNQMAVNLFLFEDGQYSYQLLQTIRHEIFHTYQYGVMDGIINWESPETVQQWIYARDHYVSPQVDFDAYWFNMLEVTAREFARQ